MRSTTILLTLLLSHFIGAAQTAIDLSTINLYYHNEKYDEALAAINSLTEKEGENFDILLLKANCHQKRDEFKTAAQTYARAEKLNDQSAILYANWAAALYNLKDMAEGEKKARQALKIDKELPEANYFMGNIKHYSFNLTSALKYYNRAIKEKSDYRDALYMRAATYAELGNYRLALRDYDDVLRIDPSLEEAKYNIGVIQLLNQSYDEASKTFSSLNASEMPSTVDFYFYKAEALYFEGEKDEACELYKKAMGMGDSESAEIYQRYCINKEERKQTPTKKRTIKAAF